MSDTLSNVFRKFGNNWQLKVNAYGMHWYSDKQQYVNYLLCVHQDERMKTFLGEEEER